MIPDLLIVGAGPAGLGAAVEGARLGLSVMLLDENGAPGGRIWQALEARETKDPDDAAGLALIRQFRESAVRTHWNATVWGIEPDGQVFWSDADGAHATMARHILLATGTIERPLPIAGWTLPGVMTVGAAQIALKTSGLVPDGRTWLAGQGPLLLRYATQALEAGGRIAGVIDLSDGFAPLRALKHVSLSALADLRLGLAWRRQLSEAGVRWIAASEIRAEADDPPQEQVSAPGPATPPSPGTQVPIGQTPSTQGPLSQAPLGQAPTTQGDLPEATLGQAPLGQAPNMQIPPSQGPLSEAPRGQAPLGQPPDSQPIGMHTADAAGPASPAPAGRPERGATPGQMSLRRISFRTHDGWQSEDADLLLLHDGVIPSVQMSRAIGCAHRWSDSQRCWQPVTDAWGRTSVPGVLIAGDAAGIGGAAAAVLSGRIAARCVGGADAASLRAAHARLLASRPLLDALFAPRPMRLDDDTLVCRCEEVTAAAVRQAARSGCQGMNQLKAYTRCGMGPCQGRMCGPVAIEVLAQARNVSVASVEPLRTRFPIKPVRVGALAQL